MERDHYFELLSQDSLAIVFMGTSITHNFELEEAFQLPHLQNRGINGDQIPGMIARLEAITRQQPRALFIEAGINDLGDGNADHTVLWDKMNTLILRLNEQLNDSCKVFILSVLPVSNSSENMPNYCSPKMNTEIRKSNQKYQDLCDVFHLTYIDLHAEFAVNGEMNPALTTDGVHLNGEGYILLGELLRPYVEGVK